MGERMRAYDWSQSALGGPGTWPQSLRTAVSILLNSRFPMFIWWGPELVTIYNDAYIPVAGNKHPQLLGQSGREGWTEIWKDLGPLVESVFRGRSTWSEDLRLNIMRRGFIEETYFTFSYSPVLDDEGGVGGLFCACVETTGTVLGRRRLEESEQLLRNTILKAPAAMGILRGPDHVVELANDRMFEIWGRPREEVLGRPVFDALPEARGFGFEEMLARVYEGGETVSVDERHVLLPRNGKPESVYVTVVYAPYAGQEGSIGGIIAVALDVTAQVLARKKIEENEAELQLRVDERTRELAAAIKELQRSNEQLEEFAHAASHDLKEPIRKIQYFTERLKLQLNEKLGEAEQGMFARVEHATRRMNALIEDLLLYSHVSQKPPEMETIDLNVKLRNVIDDLELDITRKGAVIEVEELPNVKGFRRQLQQLFQNLLTNSLKYADGERTPRIQISARVVSGAEAGLPPGCMYHRVRVQDNGIGFPQEQAERIFQMFQRLHGRAEYEGTGVGLSIVRKVAENHGGTVKACGHPGRGAAFDVYFPA